MSSELKLAKGDKLLKVVNAIYDMELNFYMMDATLGKLNEKSDQLGIRYNYKKPIKEKCSFKFSFTFIVSIVLGIIAFIVKSLLLSGIFTEKLETWELILLPVIIILIPLNGLIADFGGMIIWTLIGLAAGAVAGYCVDHVIFSKKCNKINQEYKKELAEYEATLVRQEARIKSELAQKAIISDEYDNLYKKFCDTAVEITNAYHIAGIDENYRNISSMAIMSELLRLQICTELTGAFGLYEKVRQQYKDLYMIQKLEEICEILRDISSDIGNLRDDMNRMNKYSENLVRETQNLSKLTSRTAKNSAIAAYSIEQARREAATRDMIDTIFRT